MTINSRKIFGLMTFCASALVIGGFIALVTAQSVHATTQFAKETGKSCGDCHTAAAGGGPLTPLGEKFKANGNKMPK